MIEYTTKCVSLCVCICTVVCCCCCLRMCCRYIIINRNESSHHLRRCSQFSWIWSKRFQSDWIRMKAAFDGIKWSQSVRAELWSYINLDIGLFGSSLSHTHHSPTFLFSLLSSSISAHEIFLFVFSFARWHKLNSYYQSSISAEVIIHSINISNYQVFIGPNIFVIDIVKTCIEFILFNSVQIFDANSTVQRSRRKWSERNINWR